ncbi:unnamed protein product [Ostreobium quekettii]|uniref:Replication factor C C-terminal domain-containing protein n=1 Tax=Ostreobium quekettii TaxID=121088 RepID=A0A8S1JEG6_9CHLO|nr:unnamed protein product [Ostreobium quekettii]
MPNMTLELNASDDRGINVVREEIQDFVSTRSVFSNTFKLVILDECDAMTKDAQMALRRVIEKYTKNARFCLIGNYVSKIISALQSRCMRFRFPPLEEQFVRPRLQHVVDVEGVSIDAAAMDALIALGSGDMRRSLNILQSVHMAYGKVTEAGVYNCTGNPSPTDMQEVFNWLLNERFSTVFKKIMQMQLEQGLALADITRELHPLIFRMHMPTSIRIDLVSKLADIEHRLTLATSEELQLGALVGAFTEAREKIVKVAE